MGKFVYAMMSVFIIEFALYLFAPAQISQTSFFYLITNFSEADTLYQVIIVALGALTVFGIVASAWTNINIYGLYAGVIAVFLTFIFSIMHLYNFVFSQLADVFGCGFGIDCPAAFIISALICGPFIIAYLLAALEWVRFN